ncbi:response regulator transcription factor [Streptomyces phyllanthi]|uniref:Response regulator transcription factor n=1 Tax=Streptomyces phyllanthi TaxID=1803180 RepID=A0A5N8VT77_9ACTN|nr:response regulator transcription factor [Streptomyces phyllanthi]
MITILLMDNQTLLRLSFRALLDAQPDMTVVGEAADAAEAVRKSAELSPDVVLMDVHDPGMDSIEAIRRIAQRAVLPQNFGSVGAGKRMPSVLVLTTLDVDEYAYEALRAGTSGFLSKNASPDELIATIRMLAAGDAVIAPGLTRKFIDAVARFLPHCVPQPERNLSELTAREREILIAVAAGWSNAEIGERLHVAESTVKSHVSHMLAKIGARDRVQAVVFAYEAGLVRPCVATAPDPPHSAVRRVGLPQQPTGAVRTVDHRNTRQLCR